MEEMKLKIVFSLPLFNDLPILTSLCHKAYLDLKF